MKSLQADASAGWDGLTPGHISHCGDVLYDILANIMTVVLFRKIIILSFSRGTITNNPNATDRYRPVTVSTVLSKILECIIIPSDNNSDYQYGFRSGRSTQLPVLHDTAQEDIRCQWITCVYMFAGRTEVI